MVSWGQIYTYVEMLVGSLLVMLHCNAKGYSKITFGVLPGAPEKLGGILTN